MLFFFFLVRVFFFFNPFTRTSEGFTSIYQPFVDWQNLHLCAITVLRLSTGITSAPNSNILSPIGLLRPNLWNLQDQLRITSVSFPINTVQTSESRHGVNTVEGERSEGVTYATIHKKN